MNNDIKKDQDAEQRLSHNDSKVINLNDNSTSKTRNKQANKKGKKGKKGAKTTMHSKVYSLAIKCYHEQLKTPDAMGEIHLANCIKMIDPEEMQVLAIKHDLDEVTDGIWEVAKEKPHFHIIVRMRRKYENGRVARKKVSTILNQLGITFRPEIDDLLISARGLEPVGDFSAYTAYLTHETKQAMEDGKHIYDRRRLVSNMEVAEIDAIRAKQKVVDDNVITDVKKELARLDDIAYKLGYDLGNFKEWYDGLPFILRADSKMKTIKERYQAGIDARIEESRDILRLCIFIKGAPNTGKTYASQQAIPHDEILRVGGGGTGKFDNLKPYHGGILIDDDRCPNLLNATDNYITHIYRRNSNNPVWAGDHFVVTSNSDFKEWLSDSGINITYTTIMDEELGHPRYVASGHYEAMISRFFICEVKKIDGVYRLVLLHASTRGTREERDKRMKMFMEFKKIFDASLAEYQAIK